MKKILYVIFCLTLINCTKKDNEQKKLEIQVAELQNRINTIEKEKDSINNSAKESTKIDLNKNNNQEYIIQNKQNLSDILLDDLTKLSPNEIANKWVSSYNNLPTKYKNSVATENGLYPMDFGDWYGLNRGFSWGCQKNEKLYLVWEAISENLAEKSESKAFKAGMVTQYVRNNIIKCE